MNLLIMNLLSGSSSAAADGGDNGWISIVLIGVLVVAFIVMMFFSSRSNKKRQQEQEAAINAVRPGNKVKTVGGVCGIVVEVNDEDNTFVIETGNELNGKSYLKFDKGAIYQTDAKPEKTDDKKNKDDKDGKDVAEEKPAEAEMPGELPGEAQGAEAEGKPEEK